MHSPRFTYPKCEKLKSEKLIQKLFSEGQSVAKYPVRLVYVVNPDEAEKIKMGVSVSKKHFKKASDRNYVKRLLRESYRLNKSLLLEKGDLHYAMMLLYQSPEMPAFTMINKLVQDTFERFRAATADAVMIEQPKPL